MIHAKLDAISAGVVGMRFFGPRADAEEAELAVGLLAPSCEPHGRAGCWSFPLRYLKDVSVVLKEHAAKVSVSSLVADAYRRQRKSDQFVLALKARPTRAFPAEPYEAIFEERFTPHPYQRQGIAVMLAAKRLLLGDAVGLGKTIQSVGAMALAMRRGLCRRALVVTTASLKGQWCDEAASYLRPGAVGGLSSAFVAVGGDRAKRAAAYADPAARVLVLNYELFLHDGRAIPPADMVFLDEAARIKSLGAQTTKAIKSYCARHRVRYRYALTATGIENKLEDLYSILSFLGDQSLGFHTYFLYHYCKLRRFQAPNGARIQQVVGHLNLHEAKARTAHVLLRRTKDDVGEELPELVVRNVTVDLGDAQRAAYEDIRAAADPDKSASAPFRAAVAASGGPTAVDPLQQSLLFREVCDSLALVGDGSLGDESAKLDELEHFVRSTLGPEHSVVIFTQWERMAKLIAARLAGCYAEGSPPRIISGDVRESERDLHRRDFNAERFRCLVMTDAGKAGLNLQACETMVNFELPWNPATLKQRIGRMHRSGQRHAVTTVVNLIANGTIEQRVADRLMRRHRVFDRVLVAAEDELQAMDLSKTLTARELGELA
jgi:SNF2 family DNA or RNA helicase